MVNKINRIRYTNLLKKIEKMFRVKKYFHIRLSI